MMMVFGLEGALLNRRQTKGTEGNVAGGQPC